MIGVMTCSVAAFAQKESNDNTKYPYADKSSSPKALFLETSPLRYPDVLYPFNALPGSKTLLPYRNIPIHYELRDSIKLNPFYLSPYSIRTIKGGMMDINNIGTTLLWKSSSKTSMEGSAFILQQYGYMLNSKYRAAGLKMKFNYYFNSKYNLSLWGQYLLNRNNDPFIRAIDNQSQNGIGLTLEYNPNANIKLSIDVSTQNFYSPKKISLQVEGKASFKF